MFIVSSELLFILNHIDKVNSDSSNSGTISPTTEDNEPSKDMTSTTNAIFTTPEDEHLTGWRLPRNVIPTHYNLTLAPNLKDGTFTGQIDISFTAVETVSLIRMHSKGLKIDRVECGDLVTTHTRQSISLEKVPSRELIEISMNPELPVGEHEMTINFRGDMKNRIVGFYRSSYTNENGVERFIATSKLEPTYARQAFPCFDEPNFKAKYTINLVKPKENGYIALSNMDQLDSAPVPVDDDHELVTFNTSVPMSTYVTCFIVCDFQYKEQILNVSHGSDIRLRVYATPAQLNKTQFALEVAANVTKYYVDYFGIEYPLPKLDMIAIPDFVSGAMEHWGLVTYRETALLYDEASSNAANKARVATVVAHELAHMWFGNLVTLDWWNDLWLNEGFATYMQFKAINEIIKDWGMADQFLIDELHPVMEFDATLASHPIVQTVITPDQITEIFDSISYNKGAAVVRMLENAVGEENFQAGIKKYLEKYKYKNAITQNLWDELQTPELDFNVQEVMDTWTVQVGYPVVNVKRDGDELVLTQKRFLADPEKENEAEPSVYNYKWSIPITYVTDVDPQVQKTVWFNRTDDQLKISVPGAKWIKLNHREVGYYRVNYTADMWALLAQNIQVMSISDRTHLLDDAFSIAHAGQLSYQVPLDMTKYLVNETEYVPWTVAASKFKGLKTLIQSNAVYSKLQTHVQTLLNKLYTDLSWEVKSEEGQLNRLLRAQILDLACTFGHKDCLEQAKMKLGAWLNGSESLELDTKALVYRYGMVNINEQDWQKVFEKYMKENDAQEKLKLLRGLASTNNLNLLNTLLERAQNENVVRSQDYFTCLQYISGNQVGTALVWDYVRQHWPELVDRFTLNDRYLGRLIPAITSTFSIEIKLDEINGFFKMYPEAGAGAISRKEALENVSNNIKWLKDNKAHVEDWLNDNIV
ncbi:uncharacterized protein CBL_12173 [Carabus blaptoides fortunei]